ncbi:hypothetical protein GOODEAATRI_009372 [Goodea atripinnis]|uniref:Uncharacterized protein n=1 Tax=Goodea atripinnis TaxID=208336 RepID=A0ABV0MQN1_9TELE
MPSSKVGCQQGAGAAGPRPKRHRVRCKAPRPPNQPHCHAQPCRPRPSGTKQGDNILLLRMVRRKSVEGVLQKSTVISTVLSGLSSKWFQPIYLLCVFKLIIVLNQTNDSGVVIELWSFTD